MSELVEEYCRRELEFFQRRLNDLKTGRLRFGTSTDGHSWNDTTADDIAHAKVKIAELTQLLAHSP